MDYRVQRGCHACAFLAQAFFSFAFDSHGSFSGVTLSGLTSDSSIAQSGNRKIVTLKRGETISIVLPSNQTTGYSWNLTPSSASHGLKRLGHKYQAPSTSLPGAGGQDFWTFQAESTGDTNLLFQYTRPWEKNQHAAVNLNVIVRVE
ncbi:MAG TPA: protease inhibitor I42 family protein [Bryobacteraceae bacterium]|nr:protease inhibitor I42 family protein [Bryobacteraceae bacterium]